jgi:O-antigen/teichoic acid export membrane protein
VGVAQTARVVVQALTFVLVARLLGPSGFGTFAATLALVMIVAPFAALGTGNVLVMRVARNPDEFRRAWGTALLCIPLAVVPLLVVVVAIRSLFLGFVPLGAMAFVVLAELVFARVVDSAAQAFQGLERMRAASLVSSLPSLARLGGSVALLAVASDAPTAVHWAGIYALASLIAAVAAVGAVTFAIGRPDLRPTGLIRDVRAGIYFSIAQAATSVYTDIDKTMLARIANVTTAGIYAAAYRATAVAFVPITALLNASYARFFRYGTAGVTASRSFAGSLLGPAAAYGLLAGCALFLLAPLAPLVLGDAYADASSLLRWLAPLPLIQVLSYLPADALTGAGYQRLRSGLQVAAALLNISLNLVLIPVYGAVGAVLATHFSLAALACALWLALAALVRSTRQLDQPPTDAHPRLASL